MSETLTNGALVAAAYAEHVRAASERLRGRRLEDIPKWTASERIRNTPIAAQLQAASTVFAQAVHDIVTPISDAQRDHAALAVLKGISDMVQQILELEAKVRAANIKTPEIIQ
jgi:hypothetical protein